MRLSTVGPALGLARAQWVLASLILALLPIILLWHPRATHGLIFDMGPIPAQLTPGMTADEAGWIRPWVRSWRSNPYAARELFPALPIRSPPRHRLDMLPTGTLLFDSRPIDVEELRSRLDWLSTRTSGWVDFHPDPNTRYEDVLEALAPVHRSAFDRLRLDNSRYAAAFEAATARP